MTLSRIQSKLPVALSVSRLAGLVVSTLFVLAACGATGDSKSAHKPTAELSTDKREVIAAFRAGGSEWSRMREVVRGQPPLANFVVDNMVDQMLRSYKGAQMTQTGNPNGPFERARQELIELGEYSSPVLAELIDADVSDAVVAFLAADVLCAIGPAAMPEVTARLSAKNAETRRRAIAILREPGFALPEASSASQSLFAQLATLAVSDREWIVRAEACATLGSRGARMTNKRETREVLIRALLDADDDARGSATRALGALGDPRAFPALIDLLAQEVNRGNPRNVTGVRRSLVELAQDPTLEPRARGLSIRDWRAYWKAESPRLLEQRAAAEKR